MSDDREIEIPKPRGEPLGQSDEQLERLAVITEADIISAQAWARRFGTPDFVGMVEATDSELPDET